MSSHRKTREFRRKTKYPKLFLKLGLIPPDTEFNRRAHAYATEATKIAQERKRNETKKQTK